MFLKSTKFFLPISLGFLVFLTIFLFFPSSTLAIKLAIPIGGTAEVADLGVYLATFYKYFIGIIGILATVMIMFGGFRWITAAGSPEKIKEAKSNIMSAIIAVVLMLCSYLILRLINPALIDMTVPDIDTIKTIEQGKGIPLCDSSSKVKCGFYDNKNVCTGIACDNQAQKCVLKEKQCFEPKVACEKESSPSSQKDCDFYSTAAGTCIYTISGCQFMKLSELLACPGSEKRISCYFGSGIDACTREKCGGKLCVSEGYATKGQNAICCGKTVDIGGGATIQQPYCLQ